MVDFARSHYDSVAVLGIVAIFLFILEYFLGSGDVPLRKKWSKTWRMKRFLGLDK